MRISLNWLQERINVTLSPEALAQVLTIAGLEVEEIEDRRLWAEGVVIGRVMDCQPHPNANKLSVTQVDIDQGEPVTIVCGAPNVRADIFVPVAPVGTRLNAIDLKIRKAKLRGVASHGMICSLAELGLEKESEGIHIFADGDLTPGQPVAPLLGLDDVVIDFTPTANRGDAMGMIGVAREVAALTGEQLTLPVVPALSIDASGGVLDLLVSVMETEACPVYVATAIADVTIAPSPVWLQQKLVAAGVRPINNVVDITNYILLEWGQPLHAFDCDRLQSLTKDDALTIGVRWARPKESFTTLDGQQRSLNGQNLLITANDVPVALAGVMGGENSEVWEQTQHLILEAALFDPVAIRNSSRSLGLRSEASARYERGVDPEGFDSAYHHAITLIQELAGGKATTQAIADTRVAHKQAQSIQLRWSRVGDVLGDVQLADGNVGVIASEEVERLLTALNCQLKPLEGSKKASQSDSPIWQVAVPPYRQQDLQREIDLIEEVARLYGYDRFCDTLPQKTEPGGLPPRNQVKRQLRSALRAVGLTEIVHYSLVKPEGGEVTLANPLLAEYAALRTNLLDGLIESTARNLSQSNGVLNGFEIGRVFANTESGYQEEDRVAGVLGGDRLPVGRWTRSGKAAPMDWYEAKGLLASVWQCLGLNVSYKPDGEDIRFHPGRTASLWLNGEAFGRFGQLHPQLRQQQDFPDEVYAFEVGFEPILQALSASDRPAIPFQAYSSYPSVERDVAFFAALPISVGEIEQAIHQVGGDLLEAVELFDQYQGKGVPEGQRSLAFRLLYRASDRTLTETDIDPAHNKIRDALVKQFEVTLRS